MSCVFSWEGGEEIFQGIRMNIRLMDKAILQTFTCVTTIYFALSKLTFD